MGVAYLDVDGTLVGGHVILHALHYLGRHGPDGKLRVARFLADAVGLTRAERADRALFNRRFYGHFAGLREARLHELSAELFASQLAPRIFPGTAGLLARYRAAGLRVVLITGSLDLTIAPLAAHWGVDRLIANRLEFVDGVATGRLLEPVVAGPQKARLLIEDARRRGVDLADCHALSDSFADVPMLSAVGHPGCVRPGKRLERLAAVYGWPVIDMSTAEVPAPAGAVSLS